MLEIRYFILYIRVIFVIAENKHSQINPSPSQSWKCGLVYRTQFCSRAIKLKPDVQHYNQFDLQIVVSIFSRIIIALTESVGELICYLTLAP